MAGLQNIGLDLGFIHAPIRRMIFCKTLNDAGTANVIALADATTLANWQTQFNKFDHDSDYSDRFVPSPLIRQFTKEQIEATYWEVEDYKRKMRDGYADISISLLDPAPYIMANMSVFEDESISVFFVTEEAKVIGIKSGTDLKPFPIKDGSFSVPPWSPGSFDEGSTNVITFRLNSGTDLNLAVSVELATGDVTESEDFYSLRNATNAIGSPATGSFTMTITCDDRDPDAPATDIPVAGITYDEVLVMKHGTSSYTALAAAGSIAYSAGVYTVTETDVLATGTDNYIRIEHDGYNVAQVQVTVS